MHNKHRTSGGLSLLQKIILLILPVAAALLALGTGRMGIPLADVCKIIANRAGGAFIVSEQTRIVIETIRIPRILLAILVGSGLSVSGCAFQSLFSNPLATPDTLGVASGACFGAALGILIGFGMIGIQLTSLAFGGCAVLCTWLAGSGRRNGISTIVLAGIMISSLFSGLVSLVKFAADTESQLPAITYWLMGSLNGASYRSLAFGALPIIISIAVLWSVRWRLNILLLSDDEANSSGTNIRILRIITILCATAITASCVSMCGQVGWVGLLVPHICRMRFGNNHLALIPASVSVGAIFMLIVDTIARSISSAEIPVSVLTAIIGAPFFIFLMRRSKGGWL
ncbi:MAG: iron ABC transporter permease [Firmicutes bacterium]|nr:iron ABC transporter permease [Bacillota bacterium]